MNVYKEEATTTTKATTKKQPKQQQQETIEKNEDDKPLNNDQVLAIFYKKVLSWDASRIHRMTERLRPVRATFTDKNDYIQTFEPLILEECRAQLERAIHEENEQVSTPTISRVRYISENNDYLEVGLTFAAEADAFQFHENDLMMVSLHHPMLIFGGSLEDEMTDSEYEDEDEDGNPITITPKAPVVPEEDPNKVVMTDDLLKKKKRVIPLSRTPVTEENKYLHLIGTVEQFETGGIKVKFCLKNIHDDRGRQMNLLLRYEMDWWTTKLCNLSTIQREFLALYLTSNTSFMKTLLLTDDQENGASMKIPPILYDKFKQAFNSSQFSALEAALEGKNITLIQGPPGTGKTHVILGLISVLLHSTEIPKETEQFVNQLSIQSSQIMDHEKEKWWNIAQPWFNEQVKHKRDNFDLIDYTFEEKEEKRKRDLWRKLRETGSIREPPRKRRILLCAPSNGAVDEIVGRLIRDGCLNHEGKKYQPNIVRVGPGSQMDVERVTLEYMVRCRQQLMNSNTAMPSSSAATAAATTSSKGNMDTNSIRSIILDDAEIIATTLSFSGSSLLTKMNGFDIVIIDEAAQAVETSTLVPIQHKCKKIILVGDPKQLPATIISPIAIKYKYDQSLFQRLQEKCPPLMLTTQYRMHSTIRQFPSRHFYNDLLEDGPNIADRATNYHGNSFFGPLVFYDLPFAREIKHGGGSVFNEDECFMAIYLYQLILRTYPEQDFTGRIGIISPYRQQVLTLREFFKNCPGISIDTVDGFQGREREIIIFSCVRASDQEGAGIGFLADVRRMNVALTRPRSSLLVIGNAKTLSINKDWNELIKHCQSNNCLVPIQCESRDKLEACVNSFVDKGKFAELSEIGNNLVIGDAVDLEAIEKKKQEENKNKRKKRSQGQRSKGSKTNATTTTSVISTPDTSTKVS
ncbi:DNA2/NAM7 helicase family protein [Cavenderia fasciculata]|uniref:DNA2/NAM7 helicase family protein n=1 Tax=Cavenderia fasciculata TaxID=261658 RepID=F4Q7J7_CACFS|nr:DNA2/NAM7 helicase family protein [Cavenderia fasciculata]EGG16379.1 DNA2/NAM7 helicase family protein [Cavenderia fasciculata]|eukprot:XP_004354763.1 DNA2/NAM7 helicase family protein [Cavenderia fasciculata]